MDVYLSFTTIPSRIVRAIHIVRTMLMHESQGRVRFTKLFLSIPMLYRLEHGFVPLKHIWELKDIQRRSRGKFQLIRPFVDYGPITKLLPVMESTRKFNIDPQKSILVIFDDECYHIELLHQAIERQMSDLTRTFTYYKYDYKDLEVPQGVDIITFYMKNLDGFLEFERKVGLSNGCFYVDDLVIGAYLKERGIPIETLDRGKHEFPWTPNCMVKDTYALHHMQGKTSRENMMKQCYNNIA